ncbi:hypothetical protein DSL72_002978 [Monilinia vaccinii-corymbosi]|uniref:Uncharacterized protein n=1 Tax=Monilinia vaccinii-corymbosi TaxID=61207 RepID=A0A8A3PE79_9HELO|nr:hypothetical protein DSL72_002978 [Monilinia vaccinii-corymbosi]
MSTTTLESIPPPAPPPCLPPNFTFSPSTLYLFLADIGHESFSHLTKFIPTLLFLLKLCPIDTILHPALRARLGVLGLQAQLRSLETISPPSLPPNPKGEEEGLRASEEVDVEVSVLVSDERVKDEGGEEGAEAEAVAAAEGNEITCRTWIKSTLHILDEEGYITFPETIGPKIVVDSIEAEAVAGAGWNKMRGTVGWERSAWLGD